MKRTEFGWNLREWFSRLPGDCPLTWVVLGANALTFLIAFLGSAAASSALAFHTSTFASRPWTALTFPLLADGHILWLLIAGYMFWLFAGSLERSWGRRDYLLFLGLTAGATAVGLWLGGALLGGGALLAGLWMPLAAAVVAWAAINPFERVLVYFVIPVQARWLGVIVLLLVAFSFRFPLGIFALAGCAVAAWFVRDGRYRLASAGWRTQTAASRPRRVADHRRLSPLGRWQRWRQRRRFIRLMRQAGLDDRDP